MPSQVAADGTRIFPEEALAVLEAVKHLRGEERSYETIRRTIVVTLIPRLSSPAISSRSASVST